MHHENALPLNGIRVVEFTHMGMGPTCGMVLADLGAEVIKVEPLGGDSTRGLMGSGSGFFSTFNRNKKSLSLDIQHPKGLEIVLKLIAKADIFSENFKSGTMDKLGLGPQVLAKLHPTLIYVSHKGFLPGPYEHRTALDEVVQMMGGLAYMTGPEGRPLRAGTSVNDIMGGMFGAIGALAALVQRQQTGRGQEVQSALFENNVLLVAQHMMQFAVSGKAAAPMPNRISAWALYDVFTVKNDAQIFLAAVSDTQWRLLCEEFQWDAWSRDARLATNNDRVKAREWLLPLLREQFAHVDASELSARFERIGLPYAPITKPQELFEDPHLLATGGLSPVTLPSDASMAGHVVETQTALLPIRMDGKRLPIRSNPPQLGIDTQALLEDLGYDGAQIQALVSEGVIKVGTQSP